MNLNKLNKLIGYFKDKYGWWIKTTTNPEKTLISFYGINVPQHETEIREHLMKLQSRKINATKLFVGEHCISFLVNHIKEVE